MAFFLAFQPCRVLKWSEKRPLGSEFQSFRASHVGAKGKHVLAKMPKSILVNGCEACGSGMQRVCCAMTFSDVVCWARIEELIGGKVQNNQESVHNMVL